MPKRINVLLLSFLILSLAFNSYAQNLENRVNKYTLDFGKGYTKPLVEGFGLAMNNGWFSFKAMKDLFSVDIGVTGMLVIVPGSDKSFQINSPYDRVSQIVSTAVGSSTEIEMSHTNIPIGTPLDPSRYPKGYDLGVLPMFVPQASVGNLLGTRLTLRALPKINLMDLGYLSVFGLGIQHSISQYFRKNPLPVDLSLAGSFLNMNIGDISSAHFYTGALAVSRKVSVITFYLLGGYEASQISFDYTTTFTDPDNLNNKIVSRAQFDTEGKNGVKLAIGGTGESRFARFNAGIIFLPKVAFTVGLGFGFGLKAPLKK